MLARKKYSWLLVLGLVLGLAVVLSGCGAADNQGAKTGSNGKGEVTVALAMNTLNNPFFVDVKNGAEAEAKKLGYKLIVTDAQNKPSQQLSDIENLIQQKPAVLIVDPADSDAVVPAIKDANAAGIPVFTIDRQANGGKVVTHIGYDAIHAGRVAGEFLGKALNGKGKVVELMGIMGTNVAQDRSKGFNEAIKQFPGITVVARQTANFDRAQGMSVMENILQAHPDINGVYAANDEMGLGAVAAIDAAGKTGKIVVVSNDAIDPALAAIKAGKLTATNAEPPFFLGKKAIDTVADILAKKSVPAKEILPSFMVTKDNVNTVKTRD